MILKFDVQTVGAIIFVFCFVTTGWLEVPYKIFYFNCRGRAQPIRYLLLDNNQEYEEVDIPASEKWITDYKPQMPFGQAPMLKDGDHEVAQTTAILRYVGRKCGAHPSDAKDASRADMITEVAHEMRNAYGTMCWTTYDTDTGKADHVKIANEKFQFVENLMKTWGNDFILDKICFADYYLFDVLDCHEVLSPGFLDQFPTLKAFFARMAARPAIKKFRESEVNTKRFVNGNGKQ